VTRSEAWRKEAACRGIETNVFFPDPKDRAGLAAAKAVCARCTVVEPCAQAGLQEYDGVWGGLSERGRRVARKGFRSDIFLPDVERCGTDSRYTHRGCKCAQCRQAHAQAVARRRKAVV